MDNFTISITGPREILEKIAQMPEVARKALWQAGWEAVRNIQQNYLSGSPLHVRTNNLRGSIHAEPPEGTWPTLSVTIGTNVIYAAIHEYGGDIFPVRAKALHFVIDGKHVFTKHVKMPMRPYMRPGVETAGPRMAEIIGSIIKEGLSGGTP